LNGRPIFVREDRESQSSSSGGGGGFGGNRGGGGGGGGGGPVHHPNRDVNSTLVISHGGRDGVI